MSENFSTSSFWNLIQAIRENQVVAFVGSGVSSSVLGTPGWNTCIDKLIDEAQKKSGIETQRFKEFLDVLKKNKKNDPLFVAEQCRKYLQNKFPSLVRDILSAEKIENEEARKGLESFLRLPFYRIVTTNYDCLLLDVARQSAPETKTEYFTHLNNDYFAEFLRSMDSNLRRSIFYLHGHFDNPESVILTETQYQELYARKEVVELMETIFSTKSALFIGFSMADLDVMQIFRRILSQFPSIRERHFAIFAKKPTESPATSWIRKLQNNYKYGVGILYYTMENQSHAGLWKLVGAINREVHGKIEEPKGNIAILIDTDFPYERNLYEIITYINKVQSKIRYCIHHEEKVCLNKKFVAVKGDMDKSFETAKVFGKKNKEKYEGTFIITNKQEDSSYFFYDRKYIGYISTWFWSFYVGKRPSIDEFLLHCLVILTLNFYDQKFNKTMANGEKVIQQHMPDVGCLFDMTVELRKRIAVIDYPYICEGCKDRLEIAFEGKEINLNIDWLRKVMPLIE